MAPRATSASWIIISAMSYFLIDVEITAGMPAVNVPAGCGGLAFLVRRKQRPIGFLMEGRPTGSVLSSADVGRIIACRCANAIVQDCLVEELAASRGPVELPSVTIAICSKDRTDNLRRCLDSLKRLRRPSMQRPCEYEILVVDNAPSDQRTRDLVKETEARYCLEPRPGLDFARNCALRSASGDLVAFLDDDVTADAGWLEGLCEAYLENPDAAAFTGLVLPYELETDAQILFERRGGFGRGYRKLRHLPDGDRDSLSPFGAGIFGAGCNMAFKRSVMLELGGFDEALDTGRPLPGGGDLDAFYRVLRAGHVLVYEPRQLVFHQHRRTMTELRRQYWTWGLGFMAYVSKSYRTDRAARSKFRKLIYWWFRYMGKEISNALTNRDMTSFSMLRAELFGGIVGLLGEYRRSQRRIERIRQQVP